MWQSTIHRAYAPMAYAYSMSRVHSQGRLTLPEDPPIVHATGADPTRILMVGGWAVRGLGVASYDLGLAGNVARDLARISGRGVDVDARGEAHFTTLRCLELLRQEDLTRFDALVLQVGGWELLAYRPIAAWRRDIEELVEAAVALAPAGTPVVVLGNLPLHSVMNAPAPIERAMQTRLQRMNSETRAVCEAVAGAHFVEIHPDTTGTPIGVRTDAVYRQWAADITPPLAAALCGAHQRRETAPDERERQDALDALHLDREPDVRFDRIVRMAKDVLGVDSAYITVIDRDEQWVKAATSGPVDDSPRSESMCSVTIRTPGILVVEDIRSHPAFREFSWVDGADAPAFYAGYPLETQGGQRFGALCVVDTAPRHFSRDDEVMLRELALRAQTMLWQTAS